MDKADFVRVAPAYYYAAIATVLQRPWGHFTIDSLRSFYTVTESDDVYLKHDEMIKIAIDKLLVEGAISELSDPFGDALYEKTDSFERIVEKLATDTNGPYYKNQTANNRNEWMRGALYRVNDQYRSLGLSPEDFVTELPDEWAPIPINSGEASVQEAVKQLREAATAIEQDNGYAATYPQERDQVVQDLRGGLDKLSSDAVSIGWLRRTVNALKTAGLRFANTAKAQMIDGAMAAVKEVIKHHIGSALEGLWSLFS